MAKYPLRLSERLIVAIDVPDFRGIEDAVQALRGKVSTVKLGAAASVGAGIPFFTTTVRLHGMRVMLDTRLIEAPDIMGLTVEAAVRLSVETITVHAMSGQPSIMRAVEKRGTSSIIGVTVMSSFSNADYRKDFGAFPDAHVANFAQLLIRSGAQGIMCSPHEVGILRSLKLDRELTVYVNGIRPSGTTADDHARVMTPGDAIRAGADRLIVGKPIFQHPEGPARASQLILDEIAEALG